jgi:hypothetical protein
VPESTLLALFLAVCQVESGGDLGARRGDFLGPAQIGPEVVAECRAWGVTGDRRTLAGSYALFREYSGRHLARLGLPDTPRNRANLWHAGPYSRTVARQAETPYSRRVATLMSDLSFTQKWPLKAQSQLSALRHRSENAQK